MDVDPMNMNLERKMKNEESKRFSELLLVVSFSIIMVVGLILGLILALRPSKSELEKRELTKFPSFNAADFADGEFTSGVGTWYADTYPGREMFIQAAQGLKLLYGIRRDTIENVGNGDDIPDIPVIPTLPPETDPVSTETDDPVTSTEETGPEPSTEPSKNPPETTEEESIDGNEIARMNPQEAGKVNVMDLVGYCVYGFNLAAADRFCEAVSSLQALLKGRNVQVYEIMVPNNSAILLDDATKQAWSLSDERKVIQYYYGKTRQLSPDVRTVDIYDALSAHKNEYIYFKTDHHWTQLGAYYAYQEFCKAAGFTANPLSAYASDFSPTFLGSYVNTNGYKQLEANPDSITYYYPLSTNDIRFWDEEQNTFRNGKAIRNLKDFHPRYGYMGYIFGDHAISYMKNPTLKNGRKCLVVKESFGNCFAPFLIDHYEEVVIVDYRYTKDRIASIAETEGVTDVVFLNNLEAVSDAGVMQVLLDRCR